MIPRLVLPLPVAEPKIRLSARVSKVAQMLDETHSQIRRMIAALYHVLIEQRSIAPGWEADIDRYYRGEPTPSIGEVAERLKSVNVDCWCGADDHCHGDLQLGWTRRWWGES